MSKLGFQISSARTTLQNFFFNNGQEVSGKKKLTPTDQVSINRYSNTIKQTSLAQTDVKTVVKTLTNTSFSGHIALKSANSLKAIADKAVAASELVIAAAQAAANIVRINANAAAIAASSPVNALLPLLAPADVILMQNAIAISDQMTAAGYAVAGNDINARNAVDAVVFAVDAFIGVNNPNPGAPAIIGAVDALITVLGVPGGGVLNACNAAANAINTSYANSMRSLEANIRTYLFSSPYLSSNAPVNCNIDSTNNITLLTGVDFTGAALFNTGTVAAPVDTDLATKVGADDAAIRLGAACGQLSAFLEYNVDATKGDYDNYADTIIPELNKLEQDKIDNLTNLSQQEFAHLMNELMNAMQEMQGLNQLQSVVGQLDAEAIKTTLGAVRT